MSSDSGIEARQGRDAQRLDAKHESPGDGEAGNRPDPASLPSVEIRRETLEEALAAHIYEYVLRVDAVEPSRTKRWADLTPDNYDRQRCLAAARDGVPAMLPDVSVDDIVRAVEPHIPGSRKAATALNIAKAIRALSPSKEGGRL